jgi:hypothetical protein
MKILKWTGVVLFVLLSCLYVFVSINQNKKFSAPYPEVKATDERKLKN